MAIRKLTNAAYLATNWQDEVESKNDLKKGFCVVELDPVTRQIKAGSVAEMNGVIYKSDTATSPSNSPVDGQYYIYLRDIGGVFDFYYSLEKPLFNRVKNGWYGSINSTWRAIANLILFSSTWRSINYLENETSTYLTAYKSNFTANGTSGAQYKIVLDDSYSNHISTSSGSYTILEDGTYEIKLNASVLSSVANVQTIIIKKNGINTNIIDVFGVNNTVSRNLTIKGMLQLSANDVITFYQYTDTGTVSFSNTDLIIKKIENSIMKYESYREINQTSSIDNLVPVTIVDNYSGLESTTNGIKINNRGYYSINLNTSFTTSSATNLAFKVYKNGSLLFDFNNIATHDVIYRKYIIEKIAYLNENDEISIYVQSSAPSNLIRLTNLLFYIYETTDFLEINDSNQTIISNNKLIYENDTYKDLNSIIESSSIKIKDEGLYEVFFKMNCLGSSTNVGTIKIKINSIDRFTNQMGLATTSLRMHNITTKLFLNKNDVLETYYSTSDNTNVTATNMNLTIRKI